MATRPKPAAKRLMARAIDLPAHVGPCKIGQLGRHVPVRGQREFDALMRAAGGEWDAGHRHWLIERRRIGPVIRALQRQTGGRD